jgi:hypothetical protein
MVDPTVDLAQLKQSVGLMASVAELQETYNIVAGLLAGVRAEERQRMLLVMERLVLGDLGHKCNLKFGKNDWSAQACSVCGVPLEQEGQAVWLISRWENSSVMLTLCPEHANQTFEVDVDLLTGKFLSEIVPG